MVQLATMNCLAMMVMFTCWSMMPEGTKAQIPGVGLPCGNLAGVGGQPGLCRNEPQCGLLGSLVNGPGEKCSRCTRECACTCKPDIGGCVLACVAVGTKNCPPDCTLLGAELNLACIQVASYLFRNI